jgi:hypothetical protein
MFKVLGLKDNLSNIVSLCRPFLKQKANNKDLKIAYKSFLATSQPRVPHYTDTRMEFLYKPKDIDRLLNLFEEESTLDDFKQIFDEDRLEHKIPIDNVEKCLAHMQAINSDFFDLLNLVINIIFSAPSSIAGGGSTSAAVGCIWANTREYWTQQDILEFLVHETTHNLAFLDELCQTHYRDYTDLPKEENFSWSAILNKQRPLDKVLHSIIVSTEVLLFRKDHFGHSSKTFLHPPTKVMFDQTKSSIEHLKKNPRVSGLLSSRALELIEKCEQHLPAIEESI